MQIIIYLIGFVITYYVMRHIWIEADKSETERTWKDIGINAFIALFSWFGLFLIGLVWVSFKIKDIKPPKFL